MEYWSIVFPSLRTRLNFQRPMTNCQFPFGTIGYWILVIVRLDIFQDVERGTVT